MRIQCTSNKTFELSDNSEIVGLLSYKSSFSFRADAIVGHETYKIIPKGFFDTSITVSQDVTELATMHMNWKGHVSISFLNGQDFILKRAGAFRERYVLEDTFQQKLITLKPEFNWGRLNNNYILEYDNKPQDILLVLLATYAANYSVASMTAAM